MPHSTSSPDKKADGPLRIAIIGAGVAGSALAVGLSKHPHIEAHVYEAASAAIESGQGFGLSPPALQALGLCWDDMDAGMNRAGAVVRGPSRVFLVSRLMKLEKWRNKGMLTLL